MRYLDASVLAKAYLPEAGSEQVRQWLGQPGCTTARLTEVEVTSAVTRRARAGHVPAATVRLLRSELSKDLETLAVVELAREVVQRSCVLLARHPLRAGDAIQLASALVLRDAVPETLIFACTDDRLAAAAAAEGLTVERP